MIKFEEHDDRLFRILDKPVPLRENDENVLVRFIKHGVIGEYVIEHWLDCNQKNVPIYVEDVDSDGDVTVWIENGNEHHCCPFPMFEIIGTLVKEGSAEWALYQMMQGNRVTKAHLEYTYWQYDSRPHLQCISEYNCGTLQIMVSPEIWIETTDKDGWKIYKEPEPQYKVGDWVEYRLHANTAASDNNMVGQIIDIGRIGGTSIEVLPVGNYEHNSSLSTYHVIYASRIIRKLKPSEVIVNIGCLSGTIKDLSYAEDGRFWFIGSKTERCPGGMHCILYLEMLDAQTLEIVESLLKAQEESDD